MDLKQVRLNMELTQVEMAEALGISTNSWRRYEKEERKTPESVVESLNQIMEQYNCDQSKEHLLSSNAESSKIKQYLLQALKDKGADKPVFTDLVDRYINMWETTMKLEKDIDERGVSFENPRGGWSKNDSVALLVNVNKQMLIILDKLGLNANTIKMEDGGDV